MSTLMQIIRKKRIKKFRSNPKAALEKNPQKKGSCLKILKRNPKKPNSANRKVALVRLSNKRRIYAYIPGDVSSGDMKAQVLQEHAVVLVRGGRVKDLPGVRYKLIRGVYDFSPIINRKNSRSKYGTKRSY